MKLTKSLFTLVSSSIALVAALDFSGAQWIWTNELPSPGGTVPLGARAFRRLIPTPQGLTPVSANILITTDDSYTLFVNGNQVGTGSGFQAAESFCVPLFSPCGTLIAVTGVNGGGPAGVLATIQIMFSNGSTQTVITNADWKALNNANIPDNYNTFFFDDASWPNAVTEGVDGSSPWGTITLPSNTSCGCASS